MRRLADTRGALFALLLLVMAGHESEHVAQILQKDVTHETCPDDCRGLLGFVFDIEWIHFAYNASILLLLYGLFAAYRMWQPHWRRERPLWWGLLVAGIVVQSYHVVEHVAKLQQWLTNGHHAPTPGFLGKELPWHGFALIELHFTFNTVVFVCVVLGYFGLRLHREAWNGAAALGRAAVALGIVGAIVAVPTQALAWATDPPTVRLAKGIHRGPIVITRSEKLVGERGAVVRGGIVIRANDVTVRNVSILGGEYGIEVDESRHVLLDGVRVVGATLDGIHVRRSQVMIRNCFIDSPDGYTQGIDISFSADKGMNMVEGCTVVGGGEGIFVDSALATVKDNYVGSTSLHAITMIEMSMGMIERNHVAGAIGAGIYCSDQSECMIETNRVSGMRADSTSDDLTLGGHAIASDYLSHAELFDNELVGNDGGVAAFSGARITHR